MNMTCGPMSSELNSVPSGWKLIDLSAVCTLQRGFDLTEASSEPGEIPVYSSSGISYHHSRAMASPPGVVTGRKGLLGKVFFVEEPYWPHDTTLWVADFRGNYPAFVALVLEAFHLERLDAATSVPTLNRNNLAGHIVVIPAERSEQVAIAATVTDCGAQISALERMIEKKQAIKQGMMQQLLTGKTRLPGFTDLWIDVRLGEISAFITKGATPTTYGFAWESSGVPFLRSECVSERGLDMRQSMFISPAANQALRRSQVADGDILMTITGNVGRVVRLVGVGEANINQHIARVRIKDSRFDPSYVYHYLSQPLVRGYYESIVTGQAYPQISLPQVRNTKIPAVPLEEQHAIAVALDDVDYEMSLLRQRLAKALSVKQGMMQQLLTGKTRLPAKEGAA
jgi:type I restriction enzyme S subunit